MTPSLYAFATELTKTAGKLEALKALASGGKKKLVEWITKHPNKAMALAGAGTGAVVGGEDNRLKGALIGAGLGAAAGHGGSRLADRIVRPKGSDGKGFSDYLLNSGELGALRKSKRQGMIGGALTGGVVGGSLVRKGDDDQWKTAGRAIVNAPMMGTGKGAKNTAADRAKIRAIGGPLAKKAMMGAMEQPAMGTGKGVKAKMLQKKLSKQAGMEDEGDSEPSAQDVLSEMLAQSQYQPAPQEPFWADQGATDQQNVTDEAYGHGKGLKDKPAKAPAKAPPMAPPKAQSPKPVKAPKGTPKSSPPAPSQSKPGPKMYAGSGGAAKVAGQFFRNLTKQADNRNQFLGSKQEQQRQPRQPQPAPARQPPPRRAISMAEARQPINQPKPQVKPPAAKPGTNAQLQAAADRLD